MSFLPQEAVMLPSVALSLNEITIRYGEVIAVDHLSLNVERGEIFGLLGPNGSGKSSMLAAAAGVLTPIEGTVSVDGICRRQKPAEFASRIGLVPQELALYEELSAIENLRFFGRLYGMGRRELRSRVQFVLEHVGLLERANDLVGKLSGGMKQRINLAVALLHGPSVLLLDEPTVALDTVSRDTFFATLYRLRDEGHSIILTTHLLDEAEQWCDRIGILQRGSLVAVGKPSELTRSTLPDALMYGHLRSHLPITTIQAVQEQMPPEVELEITGRRVRLSAPTSELLGSALAILLGQGVEFVSFRTPPAGLEHLFRGESVPAVSNLRS